MIIKDWIINWFVNKTGISATDLKDMSSVNYFEAELIDSFGFISFLSDLEEEFGIELENDEFLDRSFVTIDGLTAIIERHVK